MSNCFQLQCCHTHWCFLLASTLGTSICSAATKSGWAAALLMPNCSWKASRDAADKVTCRFWRAGCIQPKPGRCLCSWSVLMITMRQKLSALQVSEYHGWHSLCCLKAVFQMIWTPTSWQSKPACMTSV